MNGMEVSFVANEKLKREAMAECIALSDYVLATFKVRLDLNDESIEKVEEILSYLHRQALKDKPAEVQILAFAKGFGSYIGEVYRRNHGADWGFVTIEGRTFPGLRSRGGLEFWPWFRAEKRIVEGPSNNVWHYYQTLVAKGGPNDASEPSSTSWWRRLFNRP